MNSAPNPKAAKAQECTVSTLNSQLLVFAVIYAAGLLYSAYQRDWLGLSVWFVLLPCARWVGLRLARFTTRQRGYGSVADQRPASVPQASVHVNLYTHNGCPFCPIVHSRLEALQKQMGFTLAQIDLSFHPGEAARKGIRSVPVVEAGGRRLTGNATTEQLAQLISGAAASATA